MSSFAQPFRSDVTLIEIDEEAVGLAIQDRAGFRFFTATRALQVLDNQVFATLKALRRAADEVKAGGRHTVTFGSGRRRALGPDPARQAA
jgi:hypothetical protein